MDGTRALDAEFTPLKQPLLPGRTKPSRTSPAKIQRRSMDPDVLKLAQVFAVIGGFAGIATVIAAG